MIRLVVILFVFAGGFCAGGLFAWSVWRFVLSSPWAAANAFREILKTVRLSHWIALSTDDKPRVQMVCPQCAWTERGMPDE